VGDQPWRNPRPAPELSEMRGRVPTPRSLSWLYAWWPALLWAAVIFSMSTDTFSSEHTASIFTPIVKWLHPSVTEYGLDLVNHVMRKMAHFTEYFVFGLFLYRGVREGRPGWRWTWGLSAWFVAAIYACLDEVHQAFVASRTASPYDSLLDSIGALFAVIVLWIYFNFPKRTEPAANPTVPVPE
jgi:VanZ family protein